VRVEVSLSMGEYGTPVVRLVKLDRGQQEIIGMAPQYTQLARQLTDVVPAQVQWRVALASDPGAPVLDADVHDVLLLPNDVFLMARRDLSRDVLMDYSWLIAAWVNGQSDDLVSIRRRANQFEAEVGQPLPIGARRNVKAIWGALRDRQWIYNDNPLVFHGQQRDSLQHVQRPSATLKAGAGNCLDLAVLIASALDSCGMHPAILLLPGHALVGWRFMPGEHPQYEFIEATMLTNASFEAALANARQRYQQSAPLIRRSALNSLIDDPEQFAIVVDVHDVLQRYRVTRIP
jgi:hypothetical protein